MGAVSRIEQINEELPEEQQLTIGIEDGDTKEGYEDADVRNDDENYEEGESFRGYECIRTECSGTLEVVGDVRAKVACGDCGYEYDSILPTEKQMHQDDAGPNILLTNPWILYNRILSPGQVDRFKSVDFYTFDEAHVYTNYQGGHVQYIIGHLRELSQKGGDRPTCVFASATMSNPEAFVRELGALAETDDLAYHDYEDVLDDSEGSNEERLLFRQYILPPPRQSVQGLNQLVTEAVSLWSHRNDFKTINFIDSVAEVNTQYSYVTDTILSPSGEGAEEVVRHIVDDGITGRSDNYDWKTITPDLGPPDIDTYTEFATSTLRGSIERHFADRSEDVRSDIEDRFADGDLRFLFSTQTLELGIDLDDVAVVMQYKLPPGGNEGVIQRIGRAGRSRETQRVGLGNVTLSSKPASMLYMYDSDVRKKLESTEHLPPAKIGTSAAVQKQHLMTRAIINLALDGHRTYFRDHSLRDTDELLDIMGSIRSQFKSFEYETEESVQALMERTSFEQHKADLLDHFDRIIESSSSDDTDSSVNPSSLFSTIDRAYQDITQAQEGVRTILKELRSVDGLNEPVLALVDESEPLRTLDEALEELRRAVRKSWRSKDSQQIDEWLAKHADEYEEACKNIPTPKRLRNAVYFKLFNWAEDEYDDITEFEEDTGIDADELSDRLGDTVEELDASSREEYQEMLETILENVRELENKDLRALSKRFAIQNFNDMDRNGFTNLYDALNVMFENSVRFTPLLQPPEPEFNMEVK
jgi:superfamily II DNA/RNA helicase